MLYSPKKQEDTVKKKIFSSLHIVKEILIILFFYFSGEGLVKLMGIHFPGSIVGMLFLLISLHLKWVKLDDIRTVSHFLLGYMPLFFIPAGVGVMVAYTLMKGFYIEVVVIILLTTFLVMGMTAMTVQYLLKRKKS